MWMVSNLLYSTIIFIGGNVPDDCLKYRCLSSCNLRVRFWNITTEIESLVFILIFAGMERTQKGRSELKEKEKKHLLLSYLKLLTGLNISTSLTVWIFLGQIWIVAISKPSWLPLQLAFQFQSLNARKKSNKKKQKKK